MTPVKCLLSYLLILTAAFSLQVGAQNHDSASEVENYVQFLNDIHPDLKLQVINRQFQTLKDLEALEGSLNQEIFVAPRQLEHLSCTKPECGNGGGPCPTCFHGFEVSQ